MNKAETARPVLPEPWKSGSVTSHCILLVTSKSQTHTDSTGKGRGPTSPWGRVSRSHCGPGDTVGASLKKPSVHSLHKPLSAQTILQPHHLSTLTHHSGSSWHSTSSGSLSRLPFPALHQASGSDAPLVPSTSHVPQLSVCLSPLLTVTSVRQGLWLPGVGLEQVPNKHILEESQREAGRRKRIYASLQAVKGAAQREFRPSPWVSAHLEPPACQNPTTTGSTTVSLGPFRPLGESRVGGLLHSHSRYGRFSVQCSCLANVVACKILGSFSKDRPIF